MPPKKRRDIPNCAPGVIDDGLLAIAMDLAYRSEGSAKLLADRLACGPDRLARRARLPKLLLQLGKVAILVVLEQSRSASGAWFP